MLCILYRQKIGRAFKRVFEVEEKVIEAGKMEAEYEYC